ncbi:cupin-like domain-containing protein [Bradyrhizobium japonicum]|uniref:cupin-like domain-containing protein n=1 Tax=Bradyrhizobium japonicum TaxID=375 RepID=UPI0018AD3AD4|nr:cupin-like domain-containing protein [Bradyrhizobium japonicum]
MNDSEELQQEVVQAKLDGFSEAQIVLKFVQHGHSKARVIECISNSFDYVVEHNNRIALQLRRYEELLSIFATLGKNDRTKLATQRRFPEKSFHSHYYVKNRPLVLRGVARKMRASKKWTFEYFKEQLGDIEVKAAVGRNKYADPEGNLAKVQRRLPFREFIDLVQKTRGNDVYMVARNYNLLNMDLRKLLEDFHPLPPCIRSSPSPRRTHLWIGPEGTVTPFHYDRRNILFFQIRGAKCFTIASPLAAPYIYNHYSVFSEVDPEQPDLERYPLFRNVKLLPIELNEGDALFVPVGWWHHVRSLSPSISIATSDFIYPNSFDLTE